jgi:hypothetical protein
MIRSASKISAIVLGGLLVLITSEAGFAQQRVGLFASLRGRVEAQLRGQAAWRRAALREDVYFEDLVRTFERSKARILFDDDSILTVAPETRLEVREFVLDRGSDIRRATVHVSSGIVRALVGRKFKGPGSGFTITTPTAKVGVRGTTIFVHVVSPSLTVVAILLDEAEVSNVARDVVGTVRLKPGHITRIRAGEPPDPPVPFGMDFLRRLQGETGLAYRLALRKKEQAAATRRAVATVARKVAFDGLRPPTGPLTLPPAESALVVKTSEVIKSTQEGANNLVQSAELFEGTFLGTYTNSSSGQWKGIFTQSGTAISGSVWEVGRTTTTVTALSGTISGTSFTMSGNEIGNPGNTLYITGTLTNNGQTLSGAWRSVENGKVENGTFQGHRQ